MNNRAYGFAALLAVVGVSIVFGMILGGRLNAPRTALAAPALAVQPAAAAAIQLAPAATAPNGIKDFADIVEQSLPAVVGVSNKRMLRAEDEGEARERLQDDPFFRWFFGEPDERREMQDQPRVGFGSGFMVSPDGYILTNNHVVEGAERIVVRSHTGKEYEARTIGTDPFIDLALIKIDAEGEEFPALPLGDSDSLRVGQWVIAIGNPLEFEQTVTVGVVSAKKRQVPIGSTDISLTQFIQTDAAINFGNSGGPLMDAAGNVIGINTAIRRGNLAEGIGFALPINEARGAMQQLLASGSVQRGFLGISLFGNGLSETAAEYYGLPDTNGAVVQDVTDGEPAEKAGLKKGDVIRKVSGEVVRDNRDLIRSISARRPGQEVGLEVFRDGRTLQLTAKLMDRKDSEMIRARTGTEEAPQEPDEPVEAKGLGVTVENISSTLRRRMAVENQVEGVVVVGVEIDSPVADAGIGANTVILSINDRPTPNVAAWNRVVGALESGSPAKIEVLESRDGASRYVFIRVPRAK